MNFIQEPLRRCFYTIGRFVGRHPWYFVAAPFILSIILASGFIRIDVRTTVEYLYAPTGSKLLENKQRIISLFPMNTSEYFDLGRVPNTVMFTILIILAKDGKSVLRGEIMDEVMEIDTTIRDLKVGFDGRNLTYEDVCAKKSEACIRNDAKGLHDKIKEYEKEKRRGTGFTEKKLEIQYPIYINEKTFEFVFYGTFLGGVEQDIEGNAESAEAIRLFYFMDDSNKYNFNRATKWETEVSNMLEKLESRNVTFTWFSKTSYAMETKKVTRTINIYLLTVIVLIILLTFAICMSRQWTQSKPWMSLAFIVCVILSIASGLGLGMYCGIKFTTTIVFNIFLFIGIGLNDTFIFVSDWRKTDRKDTVDNRLGQMYSEIFVPITATFLTMLSCFCIGIVIPFSGAQMFSAYSALITIFFYIYEMTFLGGCLAISGYMEAKNLHSIMCCLTVSSKPERGKSTCRRLCRTERDPSKTEVNYLLSVLFQSTYISILNSIAFRVTALGLFVAYIVVAAIQCTNLQIASGVTDIFPAKSHIVPYYDRHYKYFTAYPHRVQLVIDTPLDYSDPIVQDQVEDLLESFENSTYVESKLTGCWLRVYKKVLNDPRMKWLLRNLSFIDGLVFSFLRLPMALDLRTDIIFNENETGIDTMRCAVQTKNIFDADTEKDMLNDLERIASQSELPVFFSSMLFPSYDLHRLIRSIVLLMLPAIAGVSLAVLALLVPNPFGALIAALSTISIQVGVIGSLSLWDVTVNSFFAVMMLMIIGLGANYVYHVTYAYATSDADSPEERMIATLKYRGAGVLQTTVILILITALMMRVGSVLMVTFYKILFLVLVFGAFHALVFIPALYITIDNILCGTGKFRPRGHELDNVRNRNAEYIERIGVKGGTNI